MILNNEIICDYCHKKEKSAVKSYGKTRIDDFKRLGFTNKKINKNWYNFCSEECFNAFQGEFLGIKISFLPVKINLSPQD